MWSRVQDGEIVASTLPRVGYLLDGRAVSNYYALSPDVLYSEGWREIVDDGPPEYNPETHYYNRTVELIDDTVLAMYSLHEHPDYLYAGDHFDPMIGVPDA
jgi:hypothetical protein